MLSYKTIENGFHLTYSNPTITILSFCGSMSRLSTYRCYVAFITPISTVWWTRLYMNRTGMKPREIPTEIPVTSVPASETPILEPIYI